MGRDGRPTREKILNESKALIYENGFAGTSIDLILDRTGITKGAFFYHFKTKAELAMVLTQEFARNDLATLDEALELVSNTKLSAKDKLLNFVQHFIDAFSNLEEAPSCLYASISNEKNQYAEEIRTIVKDAMIVWRDAIEKLIDVVIAENPPIRPIDKSALADHFNVIVEGAFIMSKSYDDPALTAKHIKHFKNYLEILFS